MMINTRVTQSKVNKQWIGTVERVSVDVEAKVETVIVERTNAYPTWHMAMSMAAIDAQNLRVIHGIA